MSRLYAPLEVVAGIKFKKRLWLLRLYSTQDWIDKNMIEHKNEIANVSLSLNDRVVTINDRTYGTEIRIDIEKLYTLIIGLGRQYREEQDKLKNRSETNPNRVSSSLRKFKKK